ncbi:MAG: hypothetical protein AB7H90_12240 [Alphaproteobacteria bacterium]
MNYLARLVRQSGLRIATPLSPPAGEIGAPPEPSNPASGIEEITLELPAAPPLAVPAPAVPPFPPEPTISVHETHRTAEPPALPQPRPLISQPAEPPPRPILTETARPDRPRRNPPEETIPATAVDATRPAAADHNTERHYTLREVVEWVVHHDRPPETRAEQTGAPATATAPIEPPGIQTQPEAAGEPPARRIGAREPPIRPEPPPVGLRTAPELETASPRSREARQEPPSRPLVEERVDILIGTINVTVEAPPAAPQTVAAPAAPPPAPPPQRRAPAPSSSRLRRRFLQP